MERRKQELIVYIVSIILFHGVMFYVRSIVDGAPRQLATLMHVFFGLLQLIYIVPKLIVYRTKGRSG